MLKKSKSVWKFVPQKFRFKFRGGGGSGQFGKVKIYIFFFVEGFPKVVELAGGLLPTDLLTLKLNLVVWPGASWTLWNPCWSSLVATLTWPLRWRRLRGVATWSWRWKWKRPWSWWTTAKRLKKRLFAFWMMTVKRLKKLLGKKKILKPLLMKIILSCIRKPPTKALKFLLQFARSCQNKQKFLYLNQSLSRSHFSNQRISLILLLAITLSWKITN